MKKKKPKKKSPAKPPKASSHKLAALVLAAVAIALYIMTVGFEYAVDDELYITSNQFTKQGLQGIPDLISKESLYGYFGEQKDLVAGGRYRPLALVTWAIEYQFLGQSPAFSHFVNVLIYAFTGYLIFLLLGRLFPDQRRIWYLSFPFVAALLFVVHPIHTEVVSNIKGRVEMLGFIGSLAAVIWAIKYADTQKAKYVLFSALAFFLALSGKEDSITYLAVVPLTLFFFTKATLKNQLTITASLVGVTVLFLMIRTRVLGFFMGADIEITELLNDPFLGSSVGDKFATVFYTLGLYVKLLFFPHPLTHDYYPMQIPIISWGDLRAILSLLLYVGMGLLVLRGLLKKHTVAYGISLFLIPLSIVSNLFIPIGTFMNERFMYMPSLGFCVILTYLLLELLPRWIKSKDTAQLATKVILGVFVVGFAGKTLARVPAWKNSRTLFLTDVHTSTNSTKANTSAGGTLFELGQATQDQAQKQKYLLEAQGYLDRAISIYPNNIAALLLAGNVHFELNKNYQGVIDSYWPLFQTNPDYEQAHLNLSFMTEKVSSPADVDKLIPFYERIVNELQPTSFIPYNQLGMLYARFKNNPDRGLRYTNQALEKAPNNLGILQNLVIIYSMKQDFPKALDIGKRALKIKPDDAKVLMNLSVVYSQMGNQQQAESYFNRAVAIDPSLKR
ncbi:MAG: tetratricopeptide repeat protein [Bacteroidota bacterium]